jgi:hypothetical protein
MCHYQALYHCDKIGYVVQCTECENIQVVFGNVVMTYSREDFDDFRCWIKNISDNQPSGQNPMIRCIMIQAPCQGIQLLLSAAELQELCIMLESADTELRSLQLIHLFNS